MSLDWQNDQRKLMHAYAQIDMHKPKVDLGMAQAYLRMMVEEVCETVAAANPKRKRSVDFYKKELLRLCSVDPHFYNPVECLDGAIDTDVTSMGFKTAMNFPAQIAWDVIVERNLAKIMPNGRVLKDEFGKVQKPEGWTPPTEDLKRIVMEAGHIIRPETY